jgi:hypothetical protein
VSGKNLTLSAFIGRFGMGFSINQGEFMEDKNYQDPLWVTAVVSLLIGIACGAGLFYGLSGGI